MLSRQNLLSLTLAEANLLGYTHLNVRAVVAMETRSDGECGAVAQLGERFNGIEEVRSSSLLSSIIKMIQEFLHTSKVIDGRKAIATPFSHFVLLIRSLSYRRHNQVAACLVALLCLMLSPHRAVAQGNAGPVGSGSAMSLMDKPADVVIFVKSLSADTASIGVAYSTRINHASVKDDLRRLLSSTGWVYRGDLLIDEASSHPDQVQKFPPTTGAQLTVMHAPQVRNGAPELLPYLQAFQAFSHVEVNFALPDLQPYNGVDRFESKALSVELYKDQGVYRYETEIREHNNPLPAFTAANIVRPDAPPTTSANVPKPALTRFVGLTLAAVILGGALVGGFVYALLGRRDPKSVTVHTPVQH
jgi:hypothetical protein